MQGNKIAMLLSRYLVSMMCWIKSCSGHQDSTGPSFALLSSDQAEGISILGLKLQPGITHSKAPVLSSTSSSEVRLGGVEELVQQVRNLTVHALGPEFRCPEPIMLKLDMVT